MMEKDSTDKKVKDEKATPNNVQKQKKNEEQNEMEKDCPQNSPKDASQRKSSKLPLQALYQIWISGNHDIRHEIKSQENKQPILLCFIQNV